jgi:hypothetical protein
VFEPVNAEVYATTPQKKWQGVKVRRTKIKEGEYERLCNHPERAAWIRDAMRKHKTGLRA